MRDLYVGFISLFWWFWSCCCEYYSIVIDTCLKIPWAIQSLSKELSQELENTGKLGNFFWLEKIGSLAANAVLKATHGDQKPHKHKTKSKRRVKSAKIKWIFTWDCFEKFWDSYRIYKKDWSLSGNCYPFFKAPSVSYWSKGGQGQIWNTKKYREIMVCYNVANHYICDIRVSEVRLLKSRNG